MKFDKKIGFLFEKNVCTFAVYKNENDGIIKKQKNNQKIFE